ncbi:MAG: DUF2807 domain-containing protein [Actinobacteria bacterium]|nr:DUF2807 domain-containing protein [Actinomycetota bacterium]
MGQYKKISFLVLMLSLILVFVTSCSSFIMGSGKVITEERKVSGFDSISVGSSINLIIEQTGTESLKLEAEDNIIPLIKTDVSDNQLNIGLDSVSLGIVRPIKCYVTVKDLRGLKISSSSSAVSKKLTTDKLDIDVSSSATINVSNLLIANVSSSARVNYIGKPEIQQHISSGGSLNNINQ